MTMNYKMLLNEKLKNQFGYNNYKNNLQKKATEAVYLGKKDIFICMPSGFGKSLCFQLPIITKHNSFAIVISPTILHSKDQVDFLKSKNIAAYNWNAYTPKHVKIYIKKNMESNNPKMKLLYITPEQYISSYFQLKLTNIKPNVLSYIVMDEAHCLSAWSHDFKHLYRKLFEWPQNHLDVPIVALTATATKQVKEDIFKTLKMIDPLIFSMPLFRSNLFYDVWFIDILPNPLTHLKKFIEISLGPIKSSVKKENRNCGIIFCQKRDITVSLTNALNSMGVPTLFYDTRVDIRKRYKIKNLWNSGKVNVIITTNSFGIGISKQTVRFIVHWDNILSIENYYQESGRAGHDGKISYCRIYCSQTELNNLSQRYNTQKLFTSKFPNQQIYLQTKILLYMELIKCVIGLEHAAISKYFGDPMPLCKKRCDVCKNEDTVKEKLLSLKYLYQVKTIFNESYIHFNLHRYENLLIYLTHLLKLDQCNYIHEIEKKKIAENTYWKSNLSIFNRSNIKLELQLKKMNKILYMQQIMKINILNFTLFNSSKETIIKKLVHDIFNLKIAKKFCKIEHLKKNKKLHVLNFCYEKNIESQLKKIHKILY